MSRTALVMAGGSSERMRAAGCPTHKALRHVCGTSLLKWNLKQLFSFGFTDVSIAVNAAEDQLLCSIAELSSFAAEHGATLGVLQESAPLGTIGAARLMSEQVDDVLVINVDNLSDLDLRAVFEFHVQSGAALTIASHREPFRIPFGQLAAVDTRVTAYVEKPTFAILVSSGTYVLHRRAISAIRPNEKIHAPELINFLIESGESVVNFEHDSWWIDVNDEAALARAEGAVSQKAVAQKALAAVYA